ncbi:MULTISPECIES: DUF4838 domain-containing protein [unclassified Streptomyces]|uniref:DUF4838 domain-containing protein n=1 Tax=unclassified Streptomyces TaxID=2593676 RepID=UPI00225067CB|nr:MULTISPECIES: DUF4838 domain-containing protein [unclassified Streptomyces]MCX4790507.1 DUF4838 domain-containing protein [Streptomyces sp. NBC_01221]WSP58789.1 DUF4838 domain-containing protein [Streptomyces sp. NBC_01241]WSU20698.1 DUF4838 domain-containing protein [Streptomyces sp. NBC_01108]MCX4793766.1 DUF4838 domain-containing protein [Streptomyces sp. NBC_01242]WSJ35183.1 DUF4838 domain-containing protein [Streptomyces sp. NBC_01321]
MTTIGTPARAADDIGPEAAFRLVHNGRGKATVLWWGGATARFAASELADYVERMSGSRLQVLRARPEQPQTATSGVLVLPGSRRQATTVPPVWLSKADTLLRDQVADSYLVSATPHGVLLSGVGDRGVVYATYALLEQFGVGFFAPQFSYYQGAAETVPQTVDITVRAQTSLVTPPWPVRRKAIEEGWSISQSSLTALIDWMGKQRLNVLVFPYDYYGAGVTRYEDFAAGMAPELAKRGIIVEVGGHGYDAFLRRADYPQYYTPGVNVFNVHDDAAVSQYIANVVTYLRARPEIAIFDCWPPDGATWPKATLAEFGTATNAEVHVVNKLVSALADAGLHVQVERIAYGAGLDTPTAGYTFDPKVLIDFAAYGRTYSVPLGDPSSAVNAHHLDVLRRWRAAHPGTLAIYDYSRRYRWRELGNPIGVLAQDADVYRSVGVNGIGAYSEPANWLQFEAIHLFGARSAWNPTLTYDDFMSSYLPTRFGPAAQEVADYLLRTADDPDVLNTPGQGAALRSKYQAAAADVAAARAKTIGTSAAAIVLDRLAWGCELALADIDITLCAQANDQAGKQQAMARYRQLTQRHRFNGIQLESLYTTPRYGEQVTRAQIAKQYRSPAWGYLPQIQFTVRQGASVDMTITAQDVDFQGHGVEWTLVTPQGLTAERTQGRLRASGPLEVSETVRLSAGTDVAPGNYAVTVAFDADGGKLTSAQCSITVVR